MLAKANNDPDQMRQYLHLSKNYKNIWDGENKVFRVRNADGTWGVIDNKSMTWNPNPQGLFEGTLTARDTGAFRAGGGAAGRDR